MARDEGEYSLLVADADGTVIDTTVEPGQFVSAGQVVIRVARAGPREAAISLPETLRPAIGSVASVSLYGQAGEAEQYPSRLRQLSDAADPLTRTFEARYVLEGAAAKAPLGATVTVRLSNSTSADGLAVPLGAVTDEGQGAGVWLIDHKASSVSYRSVHVVRLEGERAVVTGALNAGDTIVALGGHVLHEGQRVRFSQARVASR
jgi:RND family efflux transporter MFP subunit